MIFSSDNGLFLYFYWLLVWLQICLFNDDLWFTSNFRMVLMGFDFGGFLEDVVLIVLIVGGYVVGGFMGVMIGVGIGFFILGVKVNRENREFVGE